MLMLPFRRTIDTSLKEAIIRYISTKYDQHPQLFTQDLQTIDQLRYDAVKVKEPHPSGVLRLQTYAAQLLFMGTKFPADV